MSRVGDCIVRACSSLHDIPAAFLCVAIFILQTTVMDYYLIANISLNHWSWIGPDIISLTLLVVSIVNSYVALHGTNNRQRHFYSLAWISWLFMSIFVSVKTIVVFNVFASQLDEEDASYFGPNTLKTAIALGSCIFFLLLTTQHDAPLGSERRRYIEELTGTVVFDILDTVDILEILFTQNKVDTFWDGLKEFILAVATLNLLIPTVPLLTLCKTNFGHAELDKRLIYLHRLLVVLAVNVPNLLVRLILWNGFSAAISPFTLKNLILIAMSLYEFYQHKKEKYEEHQREEIEMKNTKENQHFSNQLNSRDKAKNTDECESSQSEKRGDSENGFSIEDRIVTDI
ncbi:unnamed protein product [Candidula unifasciata]|uniref:Uncharacterized protein n=1 Tax=Candidula unifasciata TaxID=100452 RepID=A0A8S3Z2F9_9EUPU|nr:unnamed protein product [Candidula unifasciata]